MPDLKEAIEELLKAYKELKEIEESHRKENGELREKVKQLEEENKKLKANHIITHNKVSDEEKIEEIKNKINNEWQLKIKEKLWELDKNEHERINKIKNPNEMFPNLIYISNKKILEQLLKEGEIWRFY